MLENYRPAAGTIVQYNREFLIGLKDYRNRGGQSWQFPQGGIEENESSFEAAKRELYEETNIDPNSLYWIGYSSWLSYLSLSSARQIQFFYAIAVNKPSIIIDQKEFIAYKWIYADAFESTIYQGVKGKLYKELVADMKHAWQDLNSQPLDP